MSNIPVVLENAQVALLWRIELDNSPHFPKKGKGKKEKNDLFEGINYGEKSSQKVRTADKDGEV